MLFDAPAGLDLYVLFAKLLRHFGRMAGSCSASLFTAAAAMPDVRYRAHRAACLADRAAEFQLAVRQRYARHIGLIGVKCGFFRCICACVTRNEHTAGLVVEARLAHQLVAVGQLAGTACRPSILRTGSVAICTLLFHLLLELVVNRLGHPLH